MVRGLVAPFPWFGGKRAIAAEVWRWFGDVPNYVEPFAGSLAVLLARPHSPRIETVCDRDGFIANFWRAVQADPDAVARYADWPVIEHDLHARHAWLIERRAELSERLMGDPEFYDARIAGWWLWGICLWIGSGWCSGKGPWRAVDGRLVHLGDAGQGINRQLPHLDHGGRGIHRPLAPRGDVGACAQWSAHLRDTMRALADRLRRVRVCCGDWRRVVSPSVTTANGITAVFLDPPYSGAVRTQGLYAVDGDDVAAAARAWAIAHGDDPRLRIALCGLEHEHAGTMPPTWTAVRWRRRGGYENQGHGRGRENRGREVVWFSPHCLPVDRQAELAGLEAALAALDRGAGR